MSYKGITELQAKQKKIDDVGYVFLFIYAMSSHISTAAGSIAMAGGALAILTVLLINRGKVGLNEEQKTLSKVFFVFCILVSFTSLFSYNPMESLSGTLGMALRFTPMFMAIFFLKSQKQVQWVIIALLASVVIADCAAIKQLVHNVQTIGFVNNRIYFANQLLPMLIVAMICVFHKKYTIGVRSFVGCVAVLTAGILIFSQVRGVWLGALATYILFLLTYEKCSNKLMIFSAIFMLVTIVCFWISPDLLARLKSFTDMGNMSNIERIYMWESAWRMFIENPLVGLGFGQFGHFYTTDYHYLMPMSKHPGYAHPHNVVMTFLAETGFVGTMAFCGLFVTILVMTLRKYLKTRNRLSIVAFLSTAGFLFAGMTDNVFAMVVVFRLITLLIGMGFCKVTLDSIEGNQVVR